MNIEQYKQSLEYPLEHNVLLEEMIQRKRGKKTDIAQMDKIWLDHYPGEIPPQHR